MENTGQIYGMVSNLRNNRTGFLFPSVFVFPMCIFLCVHRVHALILGRSQATERSRRILLKSLSLVPEVQKPLGMSHVWGSHAATSVKLHDYNIGKSSVLHAVLREARAFLSTSVWCSPILHLLRARIRLCTI